MFNRLKRMYNEGKIHQEELQNAVKSGLITQEQMDEIIRANEEFKKSIKEK